MEAVIRPLRLNVAAEAVIRRLRLSKAMIRP
jgi:hypothetical protein